MHPRHRLSCLIVIILALGSAIAGPATLGEGQSPKRGGTLRVSYGNEVAQPWMKDYVYNSEWKVLYKKVWLDK